MRNLLFAALVGASLAVPAYAESAAGPDPRLGEEVDRICFGRNINGWREVDGDEKAVLLETGVNNWYRVELVGTCRGRDFRFAQTIAIDSRPAGGCVTRGDAIIVQANAPFSARCVITKINRWNHDLPAPGEAAADQ
jgi:hypothetical protein